MATIEIPVEKVMEYRAKGLPGKEVISADEFRKLQECKYITSQQKERFVSIEEVPEE